MKYSELARRVLFEPLRTGADRLCILSGYATPNMASWLIKNLKEFKSGPRMYRRRIIHITALIMRHLLGHPLLLQLLKSLMDSNTETVKRNHPHYQRDVNRPGFKPSRRMILRSVFSVLLLIWCLQKNRQARGF